MANNQSQCKECGCKCSKCTANDHDVQLHVEIENLKQKLLERDTHISTMETNFLNEASKFPNGEYVALKEELLTWQDKYKRLYEAHRRIQRVNQGLEDKLLRLVDICETEKTTLTKDVATLSHKLADANYAIKKLTTDNERYKNDVALAIQFLQCKQSNFVSQKLDSLPNEVQAKVSSYVASKRKPEEKKTSPEIKSIKVPIPTFPPTAMVYSVPRTSIPEGIPDEEDLESCQVDIVSAAIMAKVLEERERERSCTKHCDTCTCSKTLKIVHNTTHHSLGTQTSELKNLCTRCGNDAERSPRAMKIIKTIEDLKSRSVPSFQQFDNVLLQVENEPSIAQIKQSQIVKVEDKNLQSENVIYVDGKETMNSNDLTKLISDDGVSNKIITIENVANNLSSILVLPQSTVCENGITNVKRFEAEVGDILKSENPYQLLEQNVSQPKPVVHENSNVETCTDTFKVSESYLNSNSLHHRLCDQSSPSFQVESSPEEKSDSEKPVDNGGANNQHDSAVNSLKGPRYCSVRLQSGSKNILLDNVHNNIAPVLYTHPNDKKVKRDSVSIKLHKTHSQIKVKANTSSYTESCSSEERRSINLVGSVIQNQQRVAEWVQNSHNNADNDTCSSDNSRSDSLKKGELASVDPARYAEMENNVKRFLFGDSQNEFLKRVAIGKQNYQNLRDYSVNLNVEKIPIAISASNSHTETDI